MFLGALGLLIGTLYTVLTVYRCRQRWQFLCIAFWKATLSVSLGTLGVSAAWETRRLEKAWSALLVLCGLLAALYSDLVLAGLAGSLIGAPSSGNSALYFVYFAAKRLPIFSI